MTTSLETYTLNLAKKARQTSQVIRTLPHKQRKGFLKTLAELIIDSQTRLLAANKQDLQKGAHAGLSTAMLDRLKLDNHRLENIAKGVLTIARLPDPLGRQLSSYTRTDNLKISRVTVPIGSILFIFESRPNVTVDGAALCLKSGNTVILRGGKESAKSNLAFVKLIRKALTIHNIPADAVQLVAVPDYKAVNLLLKYTDYLDLVIPRGGEKLIKTVAGNSLIPVIKHYKGVCHIYVDKSADIKQASTVVLNAKVQRPGVCNAMETLLIDKNLSASAIHSLLAPLQSQGVELRGCPNSRKVFPGMKRATRDDWDEEYLDLKLSVKLVSGVDDAIEHILRHGSGHTDAVLAKSPAVQKKFIESLDSSSVMVNASTRFSDGGEYGLGAEVGISTDKIHARGPMGLESLTTYQWRVTGNGHIRT